MSVPAGTVVKNNAGQISQERPGYFSEVLIEVNCVLRLVPRPLTAAIMASAMPAAIRPYSMAVAPLSSEKKRNKACFNTASCEWGMRAGHPRNKPPPLKVSLTKDPQF